VFPHHVFLRGIEVVRDGSPEEERQGRSVTSAG